MFLKFSPDQKNRRVQNLSKTILYLYVITLCASLKALPKNANVSEPFNLQSPSTIPTPPTHFSSPKDLQGFTSNPFGSGKLPQRI